MIRESLSAQSRHAMMVGSAAAGYAFQRRAQTAGGSDSTAGTASNPPGWVRLVRKGDRFSAYYSRDGLNWQFVDADTIPMGETVYVGLPATSHSKTVAATATLDSVRIIAATLPNEPPAISITGPAAGSQYTTPASLIIAATATDPENAMLSVDFYANQTLISRDTTAPYSTAFATSTPGGYSLSAVAHDAAGNSTTSGAVSVTVQAPTNQPPTVSLTAPTDGTTFTAPATVNLTVSASDPENQLARVEFLNGSTILGSDTSAPYAFSWTGVAAGTYVLTARAYDAAGAIATSTAVSVSVTPATRGLQTAADIGSPAIAGRTSYSSGTYTVSGAGRDIWDSSDQFHYAYTQASGDVEIVARVAALTNIDKWAKIGVMVRESLAPGSRHASMFMTAGSGNAFQRRPQTSGMSEHTAGSARQVPGWVRLVRTGNVFEAYESSDGLGWHAVGSQSIQMTSSVYIGLAVTSHDPATATTATIDYLTISTPAGNRPPVVALTSPASGASFTAPATISLSASASDPENGLARVEFLSGTTVLWNDTSAPYAFAWSNVAAGTYSITAIAYDSAGAVATSSAVTVTVNAANGTPTVALTSPTNGASFTSPATINLAANASDPENQLARVEFFTGSTLLGSDASAPYTWSWTNVGAGTYTVAAVAVDAAGNRTTSAAATVTVTVATATSTSPRLVVFTASSDHATNVTSYRFDVFPSTANPDTATPVVTANLGKPTLDASNNITSDQSTLFSNLAAGNYLATVTAIGPGGSTRSATVTFSK